MALSGWFIDDIELPEAPTFDERSINRTFQSETLFNFFPSLTKSTARASDYTFKSIIYPQWKVFQLDQIASSPDTDNVILTIPILDTLFPATKFTVKTLKMTRRGPLFVPNVELSPGMFGTSPAVPFEFTITQLPDEGETTDSLDGFKEADEGGLGLVFLEELTETFQESVGDEFGPFELFMNPDLGVIVALPKVEAKI